MKYDPEDLLTIKDVCTLFGKGHMTIWKWRKKLDMPTIIIPGDARHSVRFEKQQLVKWAKEKGKKIVYNLKSPKERTSKKASKTKLRRQKLV
ncbi:hypothetical protein LCGC14_0231210 [marine sediment metagenome]|uniref:Helix-turn-helix domain-containing protein n=1 Tax=marine sediment metagenome TaxID=412755 RepID=A0A0F9UEC1_9ZZZZ